MEPTYSVFADLLAKFQSSPEWIKALWLIAVAAMVVGVSRSVAHVLKGLASRNGELWLMRLPAPPVSSRSREGQPGTHHHDDWE